MAIPKSIEFCATEKALDILMNPDNASALGKDLDWKFKFHGFGGRNQVPDSTGEGTFGPLELVMIYHVDQEMRNKIAFYHASEVDYVRNESKESGLFGLDYKPIPKVGIELKSDISELIFNLLN